MNVELRHLRAFAAVAQTSNFTRASESLHISQPSLSHTIRQLEANIGIHLFNRTTRSTALTNEGEIFLREALAILERFDKAMEHTTRLADGEVGRLRVGYLIGAAVGHVPAILRAFSKRYPDVQLDLHEFDFSQPGGGLDLEGTDVAIVRPPLGQTHELVETTLLTEARVACVPERHKFATRSTVALRELLDEPIVAAPGDGVWRDYWLLLDYRDSPPNVTHEAATFEAEMQAVAFGRGLSVVPESAAKLYARPGVKFIPIEGITDCEVAVVHRLNAPRAASNFARVARAVVRSAVKA